MGLNHYGNSFSYYASFNFKKNINPEEYMYMSAGLDEFELDIRKFKKYITKATNDIVIDIYID